MEETAATKELKQMFTQIRDERRMYANTSSRIGDAFLSLLSYLDSFKKKDDNAVSELAIGDIQVSYDNANGALALTRISDSKALASLYATGGLTAYGAGSGMSGGGTSYDRLDKWSDYTTDKATYILSALLGDDLNTRLSAVESSALTSVDWSIITGKPSTFAPSAHTHLWADITDHPTQLSAFTNDAGFTTNAGTVTSVALSVPKGLSVSGSPVTASGTLAIALSSGYSIPTTAKQTQWDTAYTNSHTHANKSVLDGITFTLVSNWNSVYSWYTGITATDTDNIINKWQEIIAFLDGISSSSDLNAIVSGINTSISNEVTRAKDSESVNASNITTLQGYFSGGSAKTATKLLTVRSLWGNSFDGTDDVSGNITMKPDDGTYIQIGGARIVYDKANSALYVVGSDGKTSANFYATGGLTAYGAGSGTSSAGTSYNRLDKWSDYTTDKATYVLSALLGNDLNTRVAELESSTLTSVDWSIIANKPSTYTPAPHTHSFQSLTGIPTTLAGYGITDANISGGVITLGTNSITPLTQHQSLAHTHTLAIGNTRKSVSLNGSQSWSLSEIGAAAISHTHSAADIANGVLAVSVGGTGATSLGTAITNAINALSIGTSTPVDTDYYVCQYANGGTTNTTYYRRSMSCLYAYIKGKLDSVYQPKGSYLTAHQSLSSYSTTAQMTAAISSAVDALTVASAGGSGKYIQAISETDGKISAVAGTLPTKLSQFTNDIHADIDGVSYGTLKIYPSAQITSSTSDDGAITPLGVNRYVSANYLPLSGGTMSGTALIQFADDGAWAKSNSGVTFPVKRGGLYWTGESDWVKLFAEETGLDNLDLIIQFGDDNSNRLQIRNASGSETAYITATGVFGGTLSGNASSASKVNNALSWSGYSSGSFNGSAVKSISIPNNTNQLTNGAGFITSSASISGNAATATKLATARSLWGQSFDGTGDVNGTIIFNDRMGFAHNYTDVWSDGTHTHPWYGYDNFNENNGVYSTVITDYFGLSLKTCSGFICLTNPGAVGINTASPSYMLDVAGTLHAAGAATLSAGLTVTGNILTTGGVTAYTSSDRRLKKNIRLIDSLGVIRSLGGTYQFDYRKDNRHSIGFIAQNVRKSELSDIVGELDGYLRINYLDTRLISLALGASMELDDEVTKLKKRVSELEKEVKQLKAA